MVDVGPSFFHRSFVLVGTCKKPTSHKIFAVAGTFVMESNKRDSLLGLFNFPFFQLLALDHVLLWVFLPSKSAERSSSHKWRGLCSGASKDRWKADFLRKWQSLPLPWADTRGNVRNVFVYKDRGGMSNATQIGEAVQRNVTTALGSNFGDGGCHWSCFPKRGQKACLQPIPTGSFLAIEHRHSHHRAGRLEFTSWVCLVQFLE